MITVHNNKDITHAAQPFTSSIVYGGVNAHTPKDIGTAEGYEAYSGKSTITMTDPTSVNETETKNQVEGLKDSRMDIFNRARAVDFAVNVGANDLSSIVAKTGATELLCNSDFGNWRKRTSNGLWEISQRVFLNCTSAIAPSYNIHYSTTGTGDEILKGSVAKKIAGFAETANETAALLASVGGKMGGAIGNDLAGMQPHLGERMSLYQTFPIAKLAESKSSSTLSSLEFTFNFGQAGIYSGEEEVVKPILAIANTFALKGTSSSSAVVGAMPTVTHAKRLALEATAKAIANGASGLGDMLTGAASDAGGSISGTILNGLNSVVDALYATMDTVALSLLGETSTIVVIIGGLVVGPFVVADISWNFDFENVDEFGFPCSGKITLGELKPIKLNVGSDFVRQWGYSVGTGKPTTDQETKAVEEAAQNKEEFLTVQNS